MRFIEVIYPETQELETLQEYVASLVKKEVETWNVLIEGTEYLTKEEWDNFISNLWDEYDFLHYHGGLWSEYLLPEGVSPGDLPKDELDKWLDQAYEKVVEVICKDTGERIFVISDGFDAPEIVLLPVEILNSLERKS